MKRNLILRTITGLLFVGVLVGGILFHPMSFGLLFLLISAATIYEFGQIINRSGEVSMNKLIAMLGGGYLFLAVMAFCIESMDSRVFIPYMLLLLYLLISELYLKKEKPELNWAYALMSQLYIGLPFALLNVLAFQRETATDIVSYNPILPLAVFVFLWSNDTGAYVVGTMFGKHRLFERISPKKSWEGAFGGCFFAILAALIMGHYFSVLSLLQWVGLAIVVVVFGTWGDLTESLLKRRLDIKDSGNILPGHGGLLDRFDSALMAIPAAAAYFYLLSYFV